MQNVYYLDSFFFKGILVYAKTKAQIRITVTGKLISHFVFTTLIEQFLYFFILNFQPLTIFCTRTAPFVLDLFGNHIVDFLTMPLISMRSLNFLSRIMRKPDLGICENKGADELRSNCEAGHHLCLHYIDSTIPLLSKSKISSFKPSSLLVQHSLCWT